jgi:hypothetical protein
MEYNSTDASRIQAIECAWSAHEDTIFPSCLARLSHFARRIALE